MYILSTMLRSTLTNCRQDVLQRRAPDQRPISSRPRSFSFFIVVHSRFVFSEFYYSFLFPFRNRAASVFRYIRFYALIFTFCIICFTCRLHSVKNLKKTELLPFFPFLHLSACDILYASTKNRAKHQGGFSYEKLLTLALAVLMCVFAISAMADTVSIDRTLEAPVRPLQDADVIITGTKNLPELLRAALLEQGYDVKDINITVGTNYEATGEAVAAGTVDLGWLPGGTYALFSDDVDVIP